MPPPRLASNRHTCCDVDCLTRKACLGFTPGINCLLESRARLNPFDGICWNFGLSRILARPEICLLLVASKRRDSLHPTINLDGLPSPERSAPTWRSERRFGRFRNALIDLRNCCKVIKSTQVEWRLRLTHFKSKAELGVLCKKGKPTKMS